jgi:small subunit ribosomal protein S35
MWNPKIRRAARDPDSPTRPEVLPKRPSKIGFISYGARPEDEFDDPEFEMDDITSTAHGELDQHREFREYARLAAWEMPLLTSM